MLKSLKIRQQDQKKFSSKDSIKKLSPVLSQVGMVQIHLLEILLKKIEKKS